MPASVFDSFYFKDRYGSAEMRAIWDTRRTLQRWLDVEVALAWAEAEVGVVPKSAAKEIARRARIGDLDLESMKAGFDRTWNPVVPVIEAFRKVLSPASGRYLHWGATSKNIFDTGMILQARDSYDFLLDQLSRVEQQLARLSETHRVTVMAGRTHGQQAIPISFGFQTASGLDELMRHRQRLTSGRSRVFVGEFGGAVGTLAALGRKGVKVQRLLMKRLDLGIPLIPVKTAGDRLAEFTLQLTLLSATLGKIAQNIYNLQRTEIGEVAEFTEGKVGSSAMPHKQNPVASGSVVFLSRLAKVNAISALEYVHAEGEDDHRQGETAWKFLPETCLLLSAQLEILDKVLGSLTVYPERMLENVDRVGGFVCSEALLMALAPRVGRQTAHDIVTRIACSAKADDQSFIHVAAKDPDVVKTLTAKEIASSLDFRKGLGEAPYFVDRVLAAYRRTQAKRRGR